MSGSVSLINGHIDPDTGITIPEMTPQEALDLLNNMEFAEQYQGKDEYGTMLLMCKDALKKQIPKKPIENRYPWAICSVCGGSIYLENVQEHIQNKETTYCEHCGQALDWSDTE